MVMPVIFIIFAVAIIAFGGRHPEAEQLYFDADFAELYDASDDTGRQMKGGEEYRRGKPTKQGDEVSSEQFDATEVAHDIYQQTDI